MNSSRNNSYNSSPGFVYFTSDSQKPAGDDQDFLSFQGPQSPTLTYSNNYNRRSSPSYGTPKFQSSPRKFNHRNSYNYSGGNNRSFHSPNNSFNKSWSNHRSPQQHYKQRQNFTNTPMMSRDGSRDMSRFFDQTSTQNPWEQLEKEFDIQKANEQIKIEEKEDKDEEKEKQSSPSGSETGSSSSSSGEEEEETP